MAERTISENLQRLKDSKSAIGNAIIAKGGTVGATDGLEEFAVDIMSIKNDMTSIDITENGTYYSGDETVVTSSTFPVVVSDSNGIPVRHAVINGNTVQSGTPSPDNPVMSRGTGERTENLFDKSSNVVAYYLTQTTGVFTATSSTSRSVLISCKPSKTYTVHVPTNRTLRIVEFDHYPQGGDAGSNYVSQETGSYIDKDVTVTTTATAKYLCVFCYNSAQEATQYTESSYFAQVMIIEGSITPSSYIPFGYKIPFSSGGVTTPVYLGEVQTTRKIKRYEFTGQETWGKSQSTNTFYIQNTPGTSLTNRNLTMCSHFEYTGQNKGAYGTYYTPPTSVHQFNFAWNESATVEEWKSYLAAQYAVGTPVTVWYVLATEETGIVNEPLMKIGEYADSLSVDVELPLLQNTKNNINVDTALKPSSASFTYNKLSEYIGYNEIDVNVSNTYTAEDEGKVVNNATLVPQTAMSTEITVNDTYDTTLYNSIVVNVPSAPTPTPSVKSDVTFYDYDGTIVQSYSANDFANLSELPANPTHEGLTAQGWNWSLADAKTYVANYGSLDIGQQYVTNDGKTRIYINLTEGRISPLMKLYLNANTKLDIDWGDGSTHSTWTTTSANHKSERHNYPDKGKYVIAITVVSGSFTFKSSSTSYNTFFTDGKLNSNTSNRAYLNSIQKIEIGAGVTSIEDYAFRDCPSLSFITIPNSVTAIGNYVFYYCYSLSSITIPNSVTSIGTFAFYGCYSLSSIIISNSVTAIGDRTFYYCYSLSSVTIPNKVTIIGNYAFAACYSLSSITISNGVTSIKEYAFQSCSSLSSITIPNDNTTIGNYAFSSCYSLSSINIPNNATMVGSYVFQNCYSLSSLTIPDKVTTIGSYTFSACYSLSFITIPDSVTSIGSYTFQGCSGMDYIRFIRTTPPTVSSSYTWSQVPTSMILYIPALVSNLYMDGTNYPSKSSFKYIGYATYASGETLPSTTTDEAYTLTWYATSADAISQINPITQGTGDEVYSRATPVA